MRHFVHHLRYLIVFVLLSTTLSATVETVPGTLLIYTKPGLSIQSENSWQALANSLSAQRSGVINIQTSKIAAASEPQRIAVVTLPDTLDLKEVTKQFKKLKDVAAVETLYPITFYQTPTDPLYKEQRYITQSTLSSIFKIPSSKRVIVAVIDSGVDTHHPDLKQAIWLNKKEVPYNNKDDDNNGYVDDFQGFSFWDIANTGGSPTITDDIGHGTHIAGTIAARQSNGIGVAGLAPNADIMPLRVTNENGYATQLDAALAVRYAVDNGATIINASWGYSAYNQVLKDAIDYALSNGVIVVAAAGNRGAKTADYPAAFNGVISVGSCSKLGTQSSFSNYGNAVTLFTVGEDILNTLPDESYGLKSGSSMSTGVLSGSIARILGYQTMSPTALQTLLKESCTPLSSGEKNSQWGQLNGDGVLYELGLSNKKPQSPEKKKSFFESYGFKIGGVLILLLSLLGAQ